MISSDSLASCARGFIGQFQQVLDGQSHATFVDSIDAIDTTTIQRGPMPRCDHPSMRYLSVLAPRIDNPAMRLAVETLDWGQLYAGGGIDDALANGMLAAQAAGTYGVFAAESVATGLFLLTPGVFYPLHTHAAHEVYCCLAGRITIQHRFDDAPIELASGQSSETPSGRLHSLATSDEPVLLAYIWRGEISAPTWWWARDAQGEWERTAWRRKPGESWKVDRRELVDSSVFSAAMV
jgi:mannose-6-phosphate isomerase-like protein (cupin superfamily)